MVDWPSSLPRYPLSKSWTETRSPTIRSFQPDLGRPIHSNSISVSYVVLEGTYRFSETQAGVFWFFWDTTLTKGLGEFTLYHPRTRVSGLVEFRSPESPPELQETGKGVYDTKLSFRVIPS